MTNLGFKIVGTEVEVGFSAATREEFDVAVARLTMLVETVWPKFGVVVVDDKPNDKPNDLTVDYHSQSSGNWREAQGLR